MSKKTQTFWQIITKNQIEIPVIQRDYAQGRETDRVEQIRLRFVDALVNAIDKPNSKPLHLDFVYGRILGKDKEIALARNKEAIEQVLNAVKGYASNLEMKIEYKVESGKTHGEYTSQKFIPLDGQQRLTTLFLLHWYLLERWNPEEKEEYLKYLRGFNYKTRKTTLQFCSFLTTGKLPSDLFLPHEKLSLQLENSTSFFRMWKNDPSVRGMLVMLEAIHKKLKTKDLTEIKLMWSKLTQNERITFDFLDLDKLDQTDELYVKMNARGKQLSDFEHFKAWLQLDLKDQEKNKKIADLEWEEKMDTTWLDFFWTKKKNSTFKVDDNFYNFFKNVNLFEYVIQSLTEGKTPDRTIIDKIRESDPEKNFISLSRFREKDFFSSNSLNFLFASLDSLGSDRTERYNKVLDSIYIEPFKSKNTGALADIFLTGSENVNLSDRVYFYAYLLFINDAPQEQENDIEKFISWMRISRNLIYNTYIQNPENFIKAVRAINLLSKNKYTIEADIENEKIEIEFFDTQGKEEVRKLKYFRLGENWKEKILEYENHSYFQGQINFIFELLGGDNENFQVFTFYGEKLKEWFESIIDSNNHLLQTALLSKGNYTISESGNKRSFCKADHGSLRARNDNWRKVFNDPDKLMILKSLLDDSRSLKDISDSSNLHKWRKFVIDYPKSITYCGQRFFDFFDELDVRLIKSKTYSGKHTDLYLFVLFQKLENLKLSNLLVKHQDVNYFRTKVSYPQILLHQNDENGKLLMTINYSHNINDNQKGFEFKIESLEEEEFWKTQLEEMPNLNFENGIYRCVVNNIQEMETVLESIMQTIKKIDTSLLPVL